MMPAAAPFTHLAAGVDFSESSNIAVHQAMSVARHLGVPLLLVMMEVMPDAPVNGPPSLWVSSARVQSARRSLMSADRKRLEELRQRLVGQGVEVSHAVSTGTADHDLATFATQAGADLIVVGTHGRRGLRRLLLGSVAESTARRADVSVLVARGTLERAEGGYRRILIGSDFTPFADRAIERGLAMAAPGAHIEVVHAWEVPADLTAEGFATPGYGELREELAADIGRSGATLVEEWRAKDVPLTFHMVEGPPRLALADRAEAIGADLIVVGSHGRRGLRRWVLGSVAESTVRHAPCSVLVAR